MFSAQGRNYPVCAWASEAQPRVGFTFSPEDGDSKQVGALGMQTTGETFLGELQHYGSKLRFPF